MKWTDELRIETPEQIEVDLELAGLGSRFLAQVVDWFWKVVATAALAVVCGVAVGLTGLAAEFDRSPPAIAAVGVAVLYALWLGYGVYFETRWNGQTPGKRSAGIRVIRAGGAPVDARAAAVRNLLAVADFLPVFHVLGALLILLTPRRQRLGDLAAGTIVIRVRAIDPGSILAEDLFAHATADYAFTPAQLAPLSDGDRNLLRSYLKRFDEMDSDGRVRVGRRLVEAFRIKTGHTAAPAQSNAVEARAFLASLLRDLEEKFRHD